MWTTEAIVHELRERGELWEARAGLVGLRGAAARIYALIEDRITRLAMSEAGEEWRAPAGVAFETLVRSEYFASFPQWLTAAGHLPDDEEALASIATAEDPTEAVRRHLQAPKVALPPAMCYHVYAALAGSQLLRRRQLTLQGTCWRHEGDRTRPLERGWAFTMREVVCLGTSGEVESFRQVMMASVVELARELGLEPELSVATDPFFAPTARGKGLLQRVKALKHELLLPVGPTRSIAAASFNNHQTFFGESFDIRLPGGDSVASGCVAFGVERWMLAFLVAHGPDPDAWPEIGARHTHLQEA